MLGVRAQGNEEEEELSCLPELCPVKWGAQSFPTLTAASAGPDQFSAVPKDLRAGLPSKNLLIIIEPLPAHGVGT